MRRCRKSFTKAVQRFIHLNQQSSCRDDAANYYQRWFNTLSIRIRKASLHLRQLIICSISSVVESSHSWHLIISGTSLAAAHHSRHPICGTSFAEAHHLRKHIIRGTSFVAAHHSRHLICGSNGATAASHHCSEGCEVLLSTGVAKSSRLNINICFQPNFPIRNICFKPNFPIINICFQPNFPIINICYQPNFPIINICFQPNFPIINICF